MPRIILVGGGSASGKTFLTNEVTKYIGEDKILRISMDDYYKDQSHLPIEERAKVNFDHPKSIDWPLFRKQVKDIRSGKAIDRPQYDFVTHSRKKETIKTEPKPLIIIEGIMALVDKEVRDNADLKIFIEASAERRFLRRIIRDTTERGRTFKSVCEQYFASVQPMFEEVIKPSSTYADAVVNNDGVATLSVNVLACLFQKELGVASGKSEYIYEKGELFDEELLKKAFRGE